MMDDSWWIGIFTVEVVLTLSALVFLYNHFTIIYEAQMNITQQLIDKVLQLEKRTDRAEEESLNEEMENHTTNYDFYAIQAADEEYPHDVSSIGNYGQEVIQSLSNEEDIMNYAHEHWKEAQTNNNPLMGVLIVAEIRRMDGQVVDSYRVVRKIGEDSINEFFEGYLLIQEEE